MKQELACSIVQDLLPNYIEKLTGDETNRFIEEHINSCEQCRSILQDMRAEISNKKSIPKKELKFLKKVKKVRIFAAVSCMLLALIGSYLLYSAEYEFSNDKGVLSTAITEYASSSKYPVNAYVLETKEVDGVLIAFFKDNSSSGVYGFARLLKGINQKYRLVNVNFNPGKYSAVVSHINSLPVKERTMLWAVTIVTITSLLMGLILLMQHFIMVNRSLEQYY